MRAGHALRAIASPTASGQRSIASPMPACGPKRASDERASSASLSRAHLHDLRRLERKRRALRRRDHDLPELGDAGREHAPPSLVELREDVVEEQQRLAPEELRLGKDE